MTSPDPAAERFALAQTIAESAGKLALDYFRHPERLRIEAKVNAQDMVSQADREVEELIRAGIADRFPEDRIIGEEFGFDRKQSDYTWVIDPIDGTSPFVNGIPAWCVSIALISGERHVAGVIFAPCTGELYAARAGHGATMNGRALSVAKDATLADGLMGLGANHRVPARAVSEFVRLLLEHGGMFTRNGSGALMLAYVAAGRLAAYYEPHINAWDCLAGLCLVREAGGWTNDFIAESGLEKGGRVIAAARKAKEPLLKLIEASGA